MLSDVAEQLSFGAVNAVLKRQWWLIAAVVVVAAVVGYAASLGADDVYTGVATISIDTAPSSRYRGMPLADDLVKALSDPETRSAIATKLGAEDSEVAASLRAAAAGNPLTSIRVTYTAASKDAAEAGARAGADQLVEVVARTMEKEVAIRQEQIGVSEKALAAIEDAQEAQGSSAQDAYQRWSIETQLLDYKNALEGVLGVYTYDGTTTSSVARASDARQKSALGAAVLGFALGIVLAGVREGLRTRT